MQTAEINSIDTTLRELAPLVTDVQRTLEAGLDESGAGAESVASVVQPLATIRGTLDLLDLPGASILVSEMGEIATAVSGGHTDGTGQALETLLEAVLRLPDYLDRMRAGRHDAPAKLLPLVNRLRALRGAEALDESAMFFPPLPAFGAPAEAADDARLQGAAQRVRGRFQRALLGWYRGGSDGGNPLGELGGALQELAEHSTQAAVKQLWEVGGAFAESLADHDGAGDGQIKTLLARIERLIAEAARGGETAVVQASPRELLRGLLYHLARTPSERAAVRDVRQAYQLEQVLSANEGESDVGGLNRELLDAVGEGIRSELAQIKDAVEIYVHGEERRTEVLEGLPERLKHIADTFSMLGLSHGHATLRGEAQVLAEINGLAADEAEQRLQTLADELLRAEGQLAQLQRGQAPREAADEEGATGELGIRELPDSEFEPLIAAVVGASLENLSKVREAIAVYCSTPEPDPETVSEVPALLAEIEGAALLLPLESASPLLTGLREYIQRELAGAGRQPDDDTQILVADVVAGLEYYLEAVAHGRLTMTHLLEGAIRALGALRSGGSPEIYDEDEQVVIEAPADAPAAKPGALDWDGDGFDADSTDEHEIALGGEDAALGAPEAEAATGELAVSGGDGDGPADDLEASAGEFDLSTGEIEASADELEPLSGEVEVSAVEADAPTGEMADSGRDFDGPSAATNEIELTLDDDPAVGSAEFEALDFSLEQAAPGASEADSEEPTGSETETDFPALGEAASATDSPGEMAAESPGLTAPASTPQAAGGDPGASGDGAATGSQFAIVGDDVDEDVVEVYIEEALGELDKINESLPRWKADPSDDEAVVVIRRAYHTLKGGGRLIGAELLGEFSWSMETLLNRVIDGSVKASTAVFDTLDEASAALPQLVEQIQGNRAPIEGIDDLIARGHALSRGETPAAPAHPITASGAEPERADRQQAHAPEASAGTASAQAVDELPTLEPQAEESGRPANEPAEQAAGAPPPADRGAEPSAAPAPAESAGAHAAVASETPEAGDSDADDSDADGPDRTLLEIFSREAASHQDALRRVFADAEPAEMEIDPAFSRPIHTLVGSSQTAGVEAIAELSGALEDIVRARREQRGMLEPEDVGVFAEAVAAIDRVLDDLPELGRVDTASVRDRLEAQRQAALAASQAADDQSDNELLDVFLGEGDELLEQCDRAVAVWRDQPEERAPIGDLQRGLHTLKGGARMANLTPIADLTHELESVINGVDAHGTVPSDATFELLQETVDALTILMEQARAQQPIARVDWLIEDLRELHDQPDEAPADGASGADDDPAPATRDTSAAGPGEPARDAAPQGPAEPAADASAAPASESSAEPAAGGSQGAAADDRPIADDAGTSTPRSKGDETASETAPAGREEAAPGGPAASQPSSEQVRVQAGVIDNLVNFAGEVSIYHSRLNEQMGQYRFNLNEFDQTVARLRTQLRTMEDETESQILYRNQGRLGSAESAEGNENGDFDPLEFDRYTRLQELSRSLSESIGDLDSLKEIMETITRDAETLLLQQSRVSSELQDGLMQTRMVRFDGLRGRLARIVRQTASQMGKKAQLAFAGGEIELDRSVQERIVAPLEHVLRNAVAHGIEAPDERERRGKAAQGTIELDLHRGGTDIVIEISDDGRGIDPEAVRRRAIERGLIDADDSRDDGEIIRLVLESGFSTADSVTQISGRGVGMDVVDAEIRRLGGTLGINTEVGRGTRFNIRLPVTLAINQAVLVETGDDVYAIPIASVEGVAQVSAGELKPMYVDPSQPFRYANSEYRLEHLGRLLGTSEPRLDKPDLISPVIMVRAGDERIALHVEQLVGRRDIVVKPVGAPVNELAGLSGATIMPDGRVILILDIGGLLRTESRFVATGSHEEGEEPEAAPAEADAAQTGATGTTVLVVDDSITIRKVTQRVLERNGYHVVTAKDGIDALSWMAHSVPDLMLLDIEMPRMDGYEVATYVRGEQRLAEVPIIMITSRTGDKHRGRAEEIGVNRYLGKPYQETDLMENIEHLLQSSTAV